MGWKEALTSLFRRVWPIAAIFLVAQTLVRATLAWRVGGEFIDSAADAIRPFLLGFWFDLAVLAVALVPTVIYWVGLPKNWRGGRLDAAMTYVGFAWFVFAIGFTAIAEHLFWTEFSTRFNFIAVDYLVYTQEVLGNIRESYPVTPMLAALAAAAVAFTWVMRRRILPVADGLGIRARAPVTAGLLAAAAAMVAVTNLSWTEKSTNAYANEITANGYYTFIHAFFHNEIDYARFYRTEDQAKVDRHMRELLGGEKAHFRTTDMADITRDVVYPGPALRKNVILVTIESFGAEYMTHFGGKRKITPNLDRLADEGILFTNLLATGTRTVRGLEAITLSVPPTPGQSIVRRPGNDDLFSLGAVLRDRGYDTAWVYGGFGLFDNMNGFYAANGYRIVDRATMKKSEIIFSNVWGVSDEDLYARAIREADEAHAAGKPFHQHVMTTSHHRPFTFPEGRIDIPSKSGREGAVKYSDYAIGKLIETAKTKPWFKDTLFVFVADHTAGAARKAELDPSGYHIPAIFYAPDFVAPRRIEWLVSQIDIAPSILGLLNISYRSRFVGEDQLNGPVGVPRAFISNYQKVALVKNGTIAILEPKRGVKGYVEGKPVGASGIDPAILHDTVTYYQFASHWKQRFKRVDSLIERLARKD